MKDFIYTLVDYINQLELDYPVCIGIFKDGPSLVVKPIEGSGVIHGYMNGMMDIHLPLEISIKSKNQEEALNVLSDVMNHMANLGDFLNTRSEAYILIDHAIQQIPIFDKEEDGYLYYTSKLTVDLTVT